MIFDGTDGGYEKVEAFIPAAKRGYILISSRNYDMRRLTSSAGLMDQDAVVNLFIKSASLMNLIQVT
jgi:hypothetical protein